MDKIERTVTLPKGARPLSAYGRNYAFSGPGKVVATYLIPSLPVDLSEGCEVMLKDFNWRRCTEKEINESARTRARGVAAETPAGKRRWYKSARSLPSISDGACRQVSVEYDIPTQQVTAASCNGYG